jgi:hypothetical protein
MWIKYGAYPGVETPLTPVGSDVLDGGDGVKEAGIGGPCGWVNE